MTVRWWRSQISELERFAQTLESIAPTAQLANELTGAAGGARAMIHELQRDENTGRTYRGIRLPPIAIVPPIANHVRPVGARLTKATIHVLYERYETPVKNGLGNDELDSIRRADFQVCVKGVANFGDRVVELEDHWRVDTHYFEGASSEPHPWIHYQRGGREQDSFSSPYGFVPGECLFGATFAQQVEIRALMQTPAPRIAAPPMDPVCAIDFVIAQHDGSVWSSLWAIPEYANIVRGAQERLWVPYFDVVRHPERRGKLIPFFGAPKPKAL